VGGLGGVGGGSGGWSKRKGKARRGVKISYPPTEAGTEEEPWRAGGERKGGGRRMGKRKGKKKKKKKDKKNHLTNQKKKKKKKKQKKHKKEKTKQKHQKKKNKKTQNINESQEGGFADSESVIQKRNKSKLAAGKRDNVKEGAIPQAYEVLVRSKKKYRSGKSKAVAQNREKKASNRAKKNTRRN